MNQSFVLSRHKLSRLHVLDRRACGGQDRGEPDKHRPTVTTTSSETIESFVRELPLSDGDAEEVVRDAGAEERRSGVCEKRQTENRCCFDHEIWRLGWRPRNGPIMQKV